MPMHMPYANMNTSGIAEGRTNATQGAQHGQSNGNQGNAAVGGSLYHTPGMHYGFDGAQPSISLQSGEDPLDNFSDYMFAELPDLQPFEPITQVVPQAISPRFHTGIGKDQRPFDVHAHGFAPSMTLSMRSGQSATSSGIQPSSYASPSQGSQDSSIIGQPRSTAPSAAQWSTTTTSQLAAWVNTQNETLKNQVRIWICGIKAKGLDPATAYLDMEQFAPICSMHPYDFAFLVKCLVLEEQSSGMNYADWSPREPSVEIEVSQDVSAQRKAAVNEYVHRLRARGSIDKPPVQSRDGPYLCIWPGCKFASHAKFDWKRHISAHWPEQVYVCELCLCSIEPGSSGRKVFVTHRKDKLGSHLTSCHDDAEDGGVFNAVERSAISIPGSYPVRCTHAAGGGNAECGVSFGSREDCLNHWEGHFNVRSRQPSIDSQASGLLASNKRVSSDPVAHSRSRSRAPPAGTKKQKRSR